MDIFSSVEFANALTIMWQGMGGIFAVMLLITLLVTLFSKFTNKK